MGIYDDLSNKRKHQHPKSIANEDLRQMLPSIGGLKPEQFYHQNCVEFSPLWLNPHLHCFAPFMAMFK